MDSVRLWQEQLNAGEFQTIAGESQKAVRITPTLTLALPLPLALALTRTLTLTRCLRGEGRESDART